MKKILVTILLSLIVGILIGQNWNGQYSTASVQAKGKNVVATDTVISRYLGLIRQTYYPSNPRKNLLINYKDTLKFYNGSGWEVLSKKLKQGFGIIVVNDTLLKIDTSKIATKYDLNSKQDTFSFYEFDNKYLANDGQFRMIEVPYKGNVKAGYGIKLTGDSINRLIGLGDLTITFDSTKVVAPRIDTLSGFHYKNDTLMLGGEFDKDIEFISYNDATFRIISDIPIYDTKRMIEANDTSIILEVSSKSSVRASSLIEINPAVGYTNGTFNTPYDTAKSGILFKHLPTHVSGDTSIAVFNYRGIAYGKINPFNYTDSTLVPKKYVDSVATNKPFIYLYRNSDQLIDCTQNVWENLSGLYVKDYAGLSKVGDSIYLSKKGIYMINFSIAIDNTEDVYEYAVFINGNMEEPSNFIQSASLPITVNTEGGDWLTFKLRNISNDNDPNVKRVSIIAYLLHNGVEEI